MPIASGGCGGVALAQAVRDLYSRGQTDYSIEPIVLTDGHGRPIGRIQDGDAVVFCCRRGEREIQLTEAFVDPGLDRFPRQPFRDLTFVILTLYHEKFRELPVAFAPERIADTLGEIVSRAGLRQLRVAESEKFAHVSFFFNGGYNRPFPGEDDVRVPSPRGIPFDRVPGLSAAQVAGQVLRGLEQPYSLIVANLANGDVIGHTPNREAKIECARLVDARLGEIAGAALAAGWPVLVTADHGNLEETANGDGTPHVSHTTNPVPFLLCDNRSGRPAVALRDGKLADVAPTVLELLGLERPEGMTGRSLLQAAYPAAGQSSMPRVLLLILDGWGIGRNDDTNPIWLAPTPAWDDLTRRYPCARLEAAGEAVGLRPGKAGNSEAGHMNIAAGRVVLQDDVRLDLAMQDGSFYTNDVLARAIAGAQSRGASLHAIALLSEKSSHGSIDYPLALLRMARAAGLARAYLHVIFDGRSTQPGTAPALLEKLDGQVRAIGVGQIVTGMGRGIALDRNGDYDRTGRAYAALVFGTGKHAPQQWAPADGS